MRQVKDLVLSGMKPLPRKKQSTICVLDVGSSKVACIIARLTPQQEGDLLQGRTHAVEVIGFGVQRSQGLKSGVVVDLDNAEQAIRLAVDAAERMAGVTVESLIVNLSAGRIGSDTLSATVDLDGKPVNEADIARLLNVSGEHLVEEGRVIIHSMPIGFSIDGESGIDDPRNMLGDVLGVDIHMVTADSAPVKNLELVINRCHLEVEAMVATPFATGLSILVEDEAQLGIGCIDIGGGTTTLSVFHEGECVFVHSLPIGGNHITMDIARGLSTSLEEAERIKNLDGSALPGGRDDRDVLKIRSISSDDEHHIPRASLTRIIRPRVEEILEMAKSTFEEAGFLGLASKRLVLTGGSSQLTGMLEVTQRMIARDTRLGRPLGIAGMPNEAKSAAFSSVVGLLIFPQLLRIDQPSFRKKTFQQTGTGGYIAQLGQWIKESF